MDLAFANPSAFPAFHLWDATTLPSTGSDYTPILISLHPPSPHNDKPRPRWQEVDWPSRTDQLKEWQVPPPPNTHSPNQLDQWFSSALSTLTKTIAATAPRSRPSPKSKAWWTPLLTSLRREFTRSTQKAKKLQTPIPTPTRDRPSLVTLRVSRGRKPPTGPIFLQKPLRTTSRRPSNWSPREKLLEFPPFPMPQVQWQLTRRYWTTSSLPKTPCPAGAASIKTPWPPLSHLRKSDSPFPSPPPPRPLALTGFLIRYGRKSTSSTPRSSLSSSPPWWHSATTLPH